MLSRSLRASVSALALFALGNAFAAGPSEPRNVLLYQIPSGLKVTGSTGPGPGTGNPGTENPETENPGTENPGTGTPPKTPAKLNWAPSLTWGSFTVGSTEYKTITVVVAGDEGTVTFTSTPTVQGTGFSVYEDDSNCHGTMVPGDECDVVIKVQPTAAGPLNGVLTIGTQEGGTHTATISAVATP